MWRVLKLVAALSAAAVAVLVAAAAALAWSQPNTLTLPVPTGPYPVGRLRFDWRDDKRPDPLAETAGTIRELPVSIWYPAAASTGPLADYMSAPLLEALDQAAAPLIRWTVGTMMTPPRGVHSHSIEAPGVAEGSFPVLILWPMRGGLVAQYAGLAEDLASHGYVIVGADLPHTTRLVQYQDGRVAYRTATGAPPEFAPGRASPLMPGVPNDLFLPVLDVLVADGRFLLDKIAELSAGDSRFAGRLDLTSVGVLGHSVGGSAALELCAVDARCKAGIDIDGYLAGSVVHSRLEKPFMFLMSDRPIFRKSQGELSADEQALLDALAFIRGGLLDEIRLVVLEGAGHFSFGDSALLVAPAVARLTGVTIDAQRALAATRAYVRTFFDVHLRGRPASEIDGLSARFPEARVL